MQKRLETPNFAKDSSPLRSDLISPHFLLPLLDSSEPCLVLGNLLLCGGVVLLTVLVNVELFLSLAHRLKALWLAFLVLQAALPEMRLGLSLLRFTFWLDLPLLLRVVLSSYESLLCNFMGLFVLEVTLIPFRNDVQIRVGLVIFALLMQKTSLTLSFLTTDVF